MSTSSKSITVEATVKAPADKVWAYYTGPEHIMKWNNASDDWHTPKSEVDLRPGGKFSSIMAARDGSMSFDFWGIYDVVTENKHIAYTMGDGRKATIDFHPEGNETKVVVTFEMEDENSEELQRGGWQAILNNFKLYTESNP